MRLAVTYEKETGDVFQHFGHTETFKVYDIAEGEIRGEQVIDTNGTGHGALAGLLAMEKVDALICGGIGGGARHSWRESFPTIRIPCAVITGRITPAVTTRKIIAAVVMRVETAAADVTDGIRITSPERERMNSPFSFAI